MSEPQATDQATPAGADAPWHPLDIDPATSPFPTRARCGDEQILVFKVKDGFRGTARVCPHQFFPLADAVLQGNDAMLRCSRHSYVFRLSDGKGINCPGYRLKVYEVKVENGMLVARAAS